MRPRYPLLCCTLLLASGCYTYAPTALDNIPRGAEVRARLTEAEMARIRDALPARGRSVEGVVLEGSDPLLLRVPVPAVAGTLPTGALHQQLSIPRAEVVEVEIKRLDRARTTLLVASGALVVGAVAAWQLRGGGGGDGNLPPGGGGPAEASFPVRLPLHLLLRTR
jgi:hypothetical protein